MLGMLEELGVVCWIKESERCDCKRRERDCSRDDEYRQHHARQYHCDEYPPGEEALLPERAHVLEHARIHHGIIERERYLEHDKERGGEERYWTQEHAHSEEYDEGDESRDEEKFEHLLRT